jgi:hypothetical protein
VNEFAHEVKAKLAAASSLVGRTGARSFTLRYSEPDEEEDGPTVWIAIAAFGREDEEIHSVAGALDPLSAMIRLLDELIDGGTCGKCGKATSFWQHEDPDMTAVPRVIEGRPVCWFTWDAASEKFLRDCDRARPNGGSGGVG